VKSTFSSTNQFWTEIASSTGLCGYIATNSASSSCLTTYEAASAQAMVDYGKANNYWTPAMCNRFLVLIDKILRRYPATTD
jgi:hypothetical protein